MQVERQEILHNESPAVISWIMAAEKDQKIVDDKLVISAKRGNGQLRREVWVDAKGKVTRYNLAYINPSLFSGDNGRVVGYDNAHGFHHKHYFGAVTPETFISFEDTEDRFQEDWNALKGSER